MFKFLVGWKGYLAVTMAAMALGSLLTWRVMDWKEQASAGKRAEQQVVYRDKIIYKERAADDASAKIGEEAAKAQVEIRYRTKTLTEKVNVYVPVEADRRCDLSVGFVRVHDAAAAGLGTPLPDPAGRLDDATSGLGPSTAIRTVASNYGVCTANARQLTDLQNWVKTQQELWLKP